MEGFITGLHKSPFHGFSAEFAEHRLYNPGESAKDIDWKLLARSDKLFVKRYEEETNLRCQIMIDHSGSMLYPRERHGDQLQPNKLTFALYAAAVLIELLAKQRDAFGLGFFGEEIEMMSEIRSSATHKQHLMNLLEQELLHPAEHTEKNPQTTHIAPALHLTAEKLKRRSLVVIFTDAFVNPDEHEALLDGLRHLRHCQHDVILFHTMDVPHEIEFDFGSRPTEFIDLETGRHIRLNPNEAAQAYRNSVKTEAEEIKRQAIRYQTEYVEVDVSQGFDQVMRPFLTKRSKKI